MTHLELKVPPLAVLLLIGAGMWAAARYVPQADVSFTGTGVLAVLLVLAGAGLATDAIRRFRRQETTVLPHKPEEASAIVTTGIYGYTRNPMYLGLVCLLTAWALKLGNVVALLGIPLFIAYMTQFQIKPEERALRELFGDSYVDYVSRVRRWL